MDILSWFIEMIRSLLAPIGESFTIIADAVAPTIPPSSATPVEIPPGMSEVEFLWQLIGRMILQQIQLLFIVIIAGAPIVLLLVGITYRVSRRLYRNEQFKARTHDTAQSALEAHSEEVKWFWMSRDNEARAATHRESMRTKRHRILHKIELEGGLKPTNHASTQRLRTTRSLRARANSFWA